MRKIQLSVITLLSSLLIFSSVSVNAKEINEATLNTRIKDDRFNSHAIPLKDGDTLNLPSSYDAEIVTNPETGQKFVKIPARVSEFGLKKTAIVNAFKYGGTHLATVLEVVSPATATYIRANSLKIATAIESASVMLHGDILQALISAGVPITIARNIAWAIDKFLL